MRFFQTTQLEIHHPKELQVQLGRVANKTVAQVSLGRSYKKWGWTFAEKEIVKQISNWAIC